MTLLSINNTCNKNCSFCIDDRQKEDELDLDIVKSIIDKETTAMSIAGGEPSLHKDFIEIIDFIFEKKLNLALTTNFLFEEKILNYLKHKEIYYIINISELDLSKNRTIVFSKNYNAIKNIYKEKNLLNNLSSILVLTSPEISYYEKYFDFLEENSIEITNLRIALQHPSIKDDKHYFKYLNNKNFGDICLYISNRFSDIYVSAGCVIYPCIFRSDYDYNQFLKTCTASSKCKQHEEKTDSPNFGIMSDLSSCYCYSTREHIFVEKAHTKNRSLVAKEMNEKLSFVKNNMKLSKECLDCLYRPSVCDGPCVAYYI